MHWHLCVNYGSVGANANGADGGTFKWIDAKLNVPVVTLSTEDKARLSKLLSGGFKRSVYWNKYKLFDNKIEISRANEERPIKELIDWSYEGNKRLFLLIIIQQVTIKFLLILSKNTFCCE